MKHLSIAAALGVAFTTAVPVQADQTTIWTTDFSGKPPYQRQQETVRTADLAQFETTAEVIRSTDFGGKPPFHRNVDVLRVVDANRLEIVEENRFVPAPRRLKN